MIEAPTRPRVLTLELNADTDADIVTALNDLATRIHLGEIVNCVSGGIRSAFTCSLRDGSSATPEEYRKQLDAYIDSVQQS